MSDLGKFFDMNKIGIKLADCVAERKERRNGKEQAYSHDRFNLSCH